jgi:hypothetical protein
METGTQILIDRMASHPEEFVGEGKTKWMKAMNMANDCLSDEEKQAIGQAYKQARVSLFNETVLKTLAGENEVEETIRYKASERYGIGVTDPRGLFGQAIPKGEGQMVGYDHNLDAFRYANAAQGLTIGANGTSSVDLMPSAFGAVPRSAHE